MFRNKTTLLIRETKCNYYSNMASKLKEESISSKDWWKTLKTFISSSTNQSIPPLKKNNTSTLYFTDEEKANIFNEYFLQQTQVDNSDKTVQDLGPPLYSNTLSEVILTPDETKSVIKSLKSDKASGPDGISNNILKESSRELSIPLCNLFNYSLQICKIPSSWKEANVTVIFKKGDPSLPSNYRPIYGKSFRKTNI